MSTFRERLEKILADWPEDTPTRSLQFRGSIKAFFLAELEAIKSEVEGEKKHRYWVGQEFNVGDETTYNQDHIEVFNSALSTALQIISKRLE